MAEDETGAAPSPLKLLTFTPKDDGTLDPIVLIEEFYQDVKAGKINPVQVVIAFMDEETEGRWRPTYWAAGNIPRDRIVALCELVKQMAIEDWRKA